MKNPSLKVQAKISYPARALCLSFSPKIKLGKITFTISFELTFLWFHKVSFSFFFTFFSFYFIILCVYMFRLLVCLCLKYPQRPDDVRHPETGVTIWVWVAMWGLGMELGSSGRSTSVLNWWSISLACSLHFFNLKLKTMTTHLKVFSFVNWNLRYGLLLTPFLPCPTHQGSTTRPYLQTLVP